MKIPFWNLTLLTFFALNSFGQGVLKFNKDDHNFGKVVEGPVVFFNFEATNKGNSPIVISNTESSCGCVVSEWTNKTILPNQKSIIKISFTTEGRLGVFTKNIEIASNAINKTYFLTVRGEVVEKGSIISTKTSNNKEAELAQNGRYNSEHKVLNDHNKQSNSNNAEMERRLNLQRPCKIEKGEVTDWNYSDPKESPNWRYMKFTVHKPKDNGDYEEINAELEFRVYRAGMFDSGKDRYYYLASRPKESSKYEKVEEALERMLRDCGCDNGFVMK